MQRGILTNNGPIVSEFERSISETVHAPFVAMANGTLALEAALSVLFPRPVPIGIPSFTFVAVASSVVRCGHTPVFIDIDMDTWTMDPDLAARKMAHVAGFIVANTFGVQPHEFFSGGMITIYDNAEGFGTTDRRFGTMDTYSFHATKVVNSCEGGGVVCASQEDAVELRKWRNFGLDGVTGDADMVGSNAKMSEIHAAFGLQSLRDADRQVNARHDLLGMYKERLEGYVVFQSGNPLNCVVLVDDRSAVEKALDDAGIDTRAYFFPIHKMKPYARYTTEHLPVTDYISSRSLALPLWAGMTADTVECICDIIREAIDG